MILKISRYKGGFKFKRVRIFKTNEYICTTYKCRYRDREDGYSVVCQMCEGANYFTPKIKYRYIYAPKNKDYKKRKDIHKNVWI